MTKAFSLFLWENSPSVNTPLGESKLNLINRALDEVDSRIVNFDTTKANQSDLLTTLADVTFDESTGIFTFTKKNGSKTTVDTKIEKLAINFGYDAESQRLVITLDDGTIQYVDMKALITELEFMNSNTVLFSVSQDGKVSASIAKGSITADMLEPNYLSNVQLYASQALTSADDAAKSAQEAEASAIRAEEAAEKAESIVGGDFATNEKVDNIISGSTTVGNANKLGGKSASEYATVENLESYQYPSVTVSSDEEFLTKLNALHDEEVNDRYYHRHVAFSYSNSLFGGGRGILRGYKQSANDGTQIIEKRTTGSNAVIAIRQKVSGTWRDWFAFATTADLTSALAGYLPLSGGNVRNMSVDVHSMIAQPSVRFAYNGVEKGYLSYNINNKRFYRWDPEDSYTAYEVLDTGNSAKVAIQSSAPSDTSALWVW